MSSTETVKAIVKRYRQEIMNEGKLNVVDEIFPEKFALNGQEMPSEGFKPFAAMWRSAFPDLVYTHDHLIAEGEWVVEHWTGRGTHRGSLMGIPPTGKYMQVMGINIHRVVNGKIVEIWEVADTLGGFQQLGILPSWDKLTAQG